MSEVTVRYVSTVNELRHPDIVFLPGSKNTMGDLLWMRQNGLEAAVKNSPVRYLFLEYAEAIRCLGLQ